MLHGKKAQRGRKQESLTINFLKKYIHYAKHRVQPELSDEVVIFQHIMPPIFYRLLAFSNTIQMFSLIQV